MKKEDKERRNKLLKEVITEFLFIGGTSAVLIVILYKFLVYLVSVRY